MKIVYVSGPITGDGAVWTRFQNNLEGLRVAREINKVPHLGALSPHGNTFMMDGDDISWEQFLELDLELLRRVDAIVMMEGWESSKGACKEKEFAETLYLPVFYWPKDRAFLENWAWFLDERAKARSGPCPNADVEKRWGFLSAKAPMPRSWPQPKSFEGCGAYPEPPRKEK